MSTPHCVPGCIQASETTRTLLMPRHTFEDRGGVEVKGKVSVLATDMIGAQGSAFP